MKDIAVDMWARRCEADRVVIWAASVQLSSHHA